MENSATNNLNPAFDMPSDEGMPQEATPHEYATAPHPVNGESEPKQSKTSLKGLSVLLFVLSILSICVSLFGASLISAILDPAPFTYAWLFIIVFIPIPIASFVFGIVVKVNGCRYVKNIIIGAIMSSLILLFSIMFGSLMIDNCLHDDAPILRVEQATSIDLPVHSYISTDVYTHDTEDDNYIGGRRIRRMYDSYVYLDDSVAEAFEAYIPADTRWLQIIPNDLVGLQPVIRYYIHGEYVIFYNVTTGEMNKTPDTSGRYEFIHIVYESMNDKIVIYEYVLDYVK